LGRELPVLRVSVMKVSIVLVPVDKMADVTMKLHEIFVTLKGLTSWKHVLRALCGKRIVWEIKQTTGCFFIYINIYPTRCNVSCSTCFGWYLHSSSGAHTTVSTASGIYHTVIAIYRYRGR
jgi:hypothetical protein